jgi:hypothetical protein
MSVVCCSFLAIIPSLFSQHRAAISIHGSVANILPMLDDSDAPTTLESPQAEAADTRADDANDSTKGVVNDTAITTDLGEPKVSSRPDETATARSSSAYVDRPSTDEVAVDGSTHSGESVPGARSQSTVDIANRFGVSDVRVLNRSTSENILGSPVAGKNNNSIPSSASRNKIKEMLTQTNFRVKRMIRLTRGSMSGGGRTRLSQSDSDDMFGEIHVPTPGELRLCVLEWMYDERGNDCDALKLENFALFEDLVPVFVSVVLHSSSKIVRNRVLRFLLDCAGESTHFAFLIISNIYALQDNEAEMAAAAKTAVAAAAASTTVAQGGVYR